MKKWISRAKHKLITYLKKNPALLKVVKDINHIKWIFILKINLKKKIEIIDPFRMRYVPTREINLFDNEVLKSKYNSYFDRGKTKKGNWDKNVSKFEELDVFISFKEHFQENKKWEDTLYYKRLKGQINEGIIKHGCNSTKELDKKMLSWDSLYNRMLNEGYKTQDQLLSSKSQFINNEDEITVRINRYGHFLFENGRHRLAIAKILEIEYVPVKVTVRHSNWANFINEIQSYKKKTKENKVFNIIPHPDLEYIPSLHYHDGFELMKGYIEKKKGTLLDIGAHWGYFCHRFENLGYSCYAVEQDSISLNFLTKLKESRMRSFKIFDSSVFEFNEEVHFDIVLAQYVFHYFLKTRSKYESLKKFLQKLRAGKMFFGTQQSSQEGMKDAYINYSPKEFAEFIVENSCFRSYRLIGEEKNYRKQFLLES